jgi:hypothetical protein
MTKENHGSIKRKLTTNPIASSVKSPPVIRLRKDEIDDKEENSSAAEEVDDFGTEEEIVEDQEEVEAELALLGSKTGEFRALGTLLRTYRKQTMALKKSHEELEIRISRIEQEGISSNLINLAKISKLEQKITKLEMNANKNSIVIYNIPEFEDAKQRQATASEPNQQSQTDQTAGNTLLQLGTDILNAAGVPTDVVCPNAAWRMGIAKTGQSRPRPIVVEFGTSNAQSVCLKHNPKIGSLEKWKNCRFRPLLPASYLRAQRRMYQVFDEVNRPTSDIKVQKAREGLRFQTENQSYFIGVMEFNKDVIVQEDLTVEVASIIAAIGTGVKRDSLNTQPD